jgi:hypothetical protein
MPENRLPRIDLEWKLEGEIRKGGDKEDTREKGRWKT